MSTPLIEPGSKVRVETPIGTFPGTLMNNHNEYSSIIMFNRTVDRDKLSTVTDMSDLDSYVQEITVPVGELHINAELLVFGEPSENVYTVNFNGMQLVPRDIVTPTDKTALRQTTLPV